MARTSPGGFVRGYSPLAGEPRRSTSASPLITPPRVELPSSHAALGVSPLAQLSSAIPPLGSSLSDLRATVAAQQRQLDGLVDKVASLLSAMHAEVLEDVRKTCRQGGPGPDTVAGGPALDLKDVVHFVDLRETEGGLRVWVQGQLRDAWERMEAKLREVQYHLTSEVRDVQGHVAGEVHSMRARLSHLEDMTLDDDDDSAELRRHVEVRLEAQSAQLHGSMGQLAAELRQHVEASLSTKSDTSLQQFAEDVLHRVDVRLQEGSKESLHKLREELRQEAEVRLEAKMTQTFGLAQRLMNELRQELQGQVVSVHETSQHLAVELRRGLEAQQAHFSASLQQLARDGAKGSDGHKGAAAVDASFLAVEEQLAGCRAAAADCARCAIEAAEATDHLEEQFDACSQRLTNELRQDLDVQREQLRGELRSGLEALQRACAGAGGGGGGGAAAVAEASAAEVREELAGVRARAADSVRCASEASAKAGAVESRLQDLAGEFRRDCEVQEERLRRALQQFVSDEVQRGLEAAPASRPAVSASPQDEARVAAAAAAGADAARRAGEAAARAEAVESRFDELSRRLADELREGTEVQEARLHKSVQDLVHHEVRKGLDATGPTRGSSAEAEATPCAAVDEQLAGCRAAAAECTRCAGEAAAKTEAMEMRFGELSDRLSSELRKDVEAQESRVSKSLQQLVSDEVQRGLSERSAGAGGAEQQRESIASVEASVAVAETHLAGCKDAAADCARCIEEASSKADASELRLKTCAEELQLQLTEHGKRIMDEVGAANPAGSAGGMAGEAEGGEVPPMKEIAQRLVGLEEEVCNHRGLLVAIRDRVLGAMEGEDGEDGDYREGDEESGSGTPRSGGSPPGRSPLSVSGNARHTARSGSDESSDGHDP